MRFAGLILGSVATFIATLVIGAGCIGMIWLVVKAVGR